MRIHAALMTMNEISDLALNLRELEPHVHTMTIVDGGSSDGTIPYLRAWARQPSGAKIRLFIHPWQDNFPGQRNNYLLHVSEIAQPGDWVLAFDPDEFLDPDARNAIPEIIADAERRNLERVGFQCRSVTYRGHERVWVGVDDYWKPLLFKWHAGLSYGHDGEMPVHEVQRGVRTATIHLGQTPGTVRRCYEHRKQDNVIWPRGARNYFAGGGGPNLGHANHRWVELRAITDRLGIQLWAQMWAYMLAGNIDPELRDWILRYRHEDGWDGASEQREWFKTFFWMLHPEELPAELRGETIK